MGKYTPKIGPWGEGRSATPHGYTCNVNSFSEGSASGKGQARAKLVRTNITKLVNTNNHIHAHTDYLFAQESNMGPGYQNIKLDRELSAQLTPHYNSLAWGTAGVVTYTGVRLEEFYTITHTPIQVGYCSMIQFKPKENWKHLDRMVLVNFYGITSVEVARRHPSAWKGYTEWLGSRKNTSDTLWARKQYQIKLIGDAIPEDCGTIVLGGDFNFVFAQEDRSGALESIPAEFNSEWGALVRRHRLEEAHQPSHTFFHIGAQAEDYKSSRLDRFYTNITHSKNTHMHVRTFIPQIPYNISATYHNAQILRSLQDADHKRVKKDFQESNIHPWDHLPVCLTFTREYTTPTKTKHTHAPLWVYETKRFATLVTYRWGLIARRSKLTGYAKAATYKKLITQVAKTVLEETQNNAKAATEEGEGIKLTLGIKLSKLADRLDYTAARIHPYQEKYKCIAALKLDGGSRDREVLLGWLDTQFNKRVARMASKGEDLHFPHLGSHKKKNKLKSLSDRLPGGRAKIRHLQVEPGSPIITDPARIAKEAASFWENNWKADTIEQADIDDFLEGYDKRVEKDIPMPGIDEMRETILGTNNSTPGPDGIPFVAYRATIDIASTVLMGVMRAVGLGKKPPRGFNHGTLYLIPKDNSCLLDKTRPITVPNTDNRIISCLIKDTISPAVCKLVNPYQTALPNRLIGENIMDFNEFFYTRKHKGKSGYLLFLDFRRAFDNVSHKFIRAVLQKAEFPQWVIAAVHCLLQDLGAYTSIDNAESILIKVEKGVKQGCPLSPLLYAILIDPLLEKILNVEETIGSRRHTVGARGYVDDLAAKIRNISTVGTIANIVQAHCRAAGGKVNQDKTHIISTLPFESRDREIIARTAWPDLKLSQAAVYLGILFGRNVTVADVYKEALEKVRDRVDKYMAVRNRFSIHERIIISNVFLITIFSYISQWFMIPDTVRRTYNTLVRRFVVPYNCVSQEALTNPAHLVGLKRTLRDLTYMNLAAMHKNYNPYAEARRFPGLNSDHLFRVEGRRNPLATFDASSMRIHHQVVYAYHFTRLYDADIQPRMQSKEVYRLLLQSEYTSDIALNYITQKLRYFVFNPQKEGKKNERHDCLPEGTTDEQLNAIAKVITDNFAKINSKIPDYVRWVTCQVIWHALATARRLRTISTAQHPAHLHPDQYCFFCSHGKDETPHIFLQCSIVELALRELSLHELGYAITRTVDNLLLAAPLEKQEVNFLVNFTAAVWLARGHMKNYGSRGSRVNIIKHHYQQVTGNTGFAYGQNSTTADNRARLLKRKNAAEQVQRVMDKRQAQDYVFFGDGGSNPNPGPSGAGLVLYHEATSYQYNRALGQGTNQVGEIFALGMGYEILTQEKRAGKIHTNSKIFVILDSSYALAHAQDQYRVHANEDIIRMMKSKRDGLGALASQIVYIWCPGHEGVEGNECVDQLATDALEYSRQHDNIEYNTYIRDNSFLPKDLEFRVSHCIKPAGP